MLTTPFFFPLANKPTYCGVFRAAGVEFLTYTMDNQFEWQARENAFLRCTRTRSKAVRIEAWKKQRTT
jgi:hypothetical protein